ncbi:unnamed protein product, partial [Symbiodinium pilosum]
APGIHSNDLPQYQTPWTCSVVGKGTPSPPPAPVIPTPLPASTCIPNYHVNCMRNPNCCDPSARCYQKDKAVAICLQTCKPGIHLNDPPRWQTPWTCSLLTPQGAP